jgi:hypothetical protein
MSDNSFFKIRAPSQTGALQLVIVSGGAGSRTIRSGAAARFGKLRKIMLLVYRLDLVSSNPFFLSVLISVIMCDQR